MSARWGAILRGVVIAAGAAVVLISLLAFRSGDWRVYVVFLLISVVLYLPYVEVLPRMILGIPQLVSTIGFLYVGGLPIIVLALVTPNLTGLLSGVLPGRWKERVPQLEGFLARREGTRLFAEQSTFILGLAVRWWVVALLAPRVEPTSAPGAIAVAEVAGHLVWGLLAILPIYPERTLLPLSASGGQRTVMADLALIVAFSITPFVFLIVYGYRWAGLFGAAAWSLSTLGLHLMLQRLNERRLTVEEQNRRLGVLNRELEHRERLSAIGKMSSVVSHQILQQLGVIGIYADLIRHARGEGEPEAALGQAQQNAGAIEGALRDVNRVLTDLLVFSRDLRLNLYEHPLCRVVEECVDECRAQAAEHGVTLHPECPQEISLTLDKLKMKQAIVNVLRNAIEASPRGSEVAMCAAVRGDWVEVVVSDRGEGIPESDREAVFSPFFTRKEHGTGLGLAIAREFTEAHGGTLSVQARADGPGTSLVFRLPLRMAPAK